MEVDEDDDRHFWKQITHHLVINELAAKNVILRFIPYNSNRVPSKDEVKDFDTNNEKMKARLAKEDKTKIVEVL
ncbi:uncharacterized protein OCT59_023812 [Rhizophagus irregularis]|uniref:uncharacterized protein n=1 Tax=Rhizophagus irregularis TaxID=588596 RepID=UPI0033232D14|nr:hypothetical protein OCT59_023812 [Rhizophagus irregularis]